MIKKDWGVQTDDGRQGSMNAGCQTSWHSHSKNTRIRSNGRLYLIVQMDPKNRSEIFVRPVGSSAVTVSAGTRHCLFSCDQEVMFEESGTEISSNIERFAWPEWLDPIIRGVRESHDWTVGGIESPDAKPTERQATQSVSQITNDADVTTSK